MQETQVGSLGREDPLEKEMANHSSILAWRIPWAEGAGGLQSIGSQTIRHNWASEHPHTLSQNAVVQLLSRVQLFAIPWTAAHQASLSITISRGFPKFMFITSVMLSSHLILWCPLLLQPSIFPSIRDFSNESSVHIRWLKYWSFSFSINPSSEYSELTSLKIDWFDLLTTQETFRSLLYHHSSKSSILWHSAFFTVQLSQPCMTTVKTLALTIWTFVSWVMSLIFNTVSKFVITFLPRGNHLISWLQSSSILILEPKERKSITAATFSPFIFHEVTGPDAMILV